MLNEAKIARELEEKARQNERLKAQNEIAYWVAHNFRNLFSGALGFLQLIEFTNSEQSSEKRSYYHQQAVESLNKACNLVDQLLNLTDVVDRAPDNVIFKDLVSKVIAKVANKFHQEGRPTPLVNYESRTGSLPVISISSRDMEIVLENIITNAVESLEEKGKIIISAEKIEDGYLYLSVMDDGRGMDELTLKKAAEPLFSTKGTVGVGMGLSLVDAIVRRRQGEIEIVSTPGEGTTVNVVWPLRRS